MQRDSVTDGYLDSLLARWHEWCSADKLAVGYPSVNPSCAMWRCSRQYDYDNGAEDAAIDGRIMAGLDACVQTIEDPWRTAIHIDARNLACGLQVWYSPRLPIDPEQREAVRLEARQRLWLNLTGAGVA